MFNKGDKVVLKTKIEDSIVTWSDLLDSLLGQEGEVDEEVSAMYGQAVATPYCRVSIAKIGFLVRSDSLELVGGNTGELDGIKTQDGTEQVEAVQNVQAENSVVGGSTQEGN